MLLDAIEKAHPDVFNILLQVLDDGRLTDNKGRIANFKNSIIIMTSNIGSHIIQENFEKMNADNEADVILDTRDQVFQLLKKSLRPEFLNRIDETIMFTPLSRKEIRKIVEIQFNGIRKLMESNGIKVEASDAVLDKLGKLGFDPQFGARPLKRVIQREILNKLSREILGGQIKKDQIIGIDLDDQGEFQFLNLSDVQLDES